jgi:hypothetical protein
VTIDCRQCVMFVRSKKSWHLLAYEFHFILIGVQTNLHYETDLMCFWTGLY